MTACRHLPVVTPLPVHGRTPPDSAGFRRTAADDSHPLGTFPASVLGGTPIPWPGFLGSTDPFMSTRLPPRAVLAVRRASSTRVRSVTATVAACGAGRAGCALEHAQTSGLGAEMRCTVRGFCASEQALAFQMRGHTWRSLVDAGHRAQWRRRCNEPVKRRLGSRPAASTQGRNFPRPVLLSDPWETQQGKRGDKHKNAPLSRA